MKNRNGFTLTELLLIIILLAALSIIIFPNIINNFQKKEQEIDKAIQDVLYSSADEYIKKYNDRYIEKTGNTYCINVTDMDEEGLIPIDVTDYKDLGVQVKFGKKTSHQIVTCDEPRSISLNKTSIELEVNSLFLLIATITPDDVKN